jgi:predicted RNase H-like HicB family nuclease
MKSYTYTVHLEPDEDGGYVVTVPALPGCVTQGETYEEALLMAEECIRGFLEALAKAGQPIPRQDELAPSSNRLTSPSKSSRLFSEHIKRSA